MQRIFHTPEGVRDIYNGECSQKHHLQTEIRTVFDSYGYEEIETPSFEYFEVFSRERFHPRIFINFLTVKETLWYYVRTLPHLFPEPAPLISIQSRKLSHYPIQEILSLITPVIRDV